jgi:hypothetical protein
LPCEAAFLVLRASPSLDTVVREGDWMLPLLSCGLGQGIGVSVPYLLRKRRKKDARL